MPINFTCVQYIHAVGQILNMYRLAIRHLWAINLNSYHITKYHLTRAWENFMALPLI